LAPAAIPLAHGLGLSEATWPDVLNKRARDLDDRIAKGSAEHVTYYVMQSSSFTEAPPIDPVRLAASRPTKMPPEVLRRFRDFEGSVPRDDRHRIVGELFRSTGWTPEACFQQAMGFLAATSKPEDRDAVYHLRGLSNDSAPANIPVLERAANYLNDPLLLVGPGLDLTRREGFSDNLPLKSHQAEWLRGRSNTLECMDVRPDVIAFLRADGVCAFRGDIAGDIACRNRYGAAIATNLLLYLDNPGLLLALAGIAAALRPGGYFIHNDTRFAAKVFGEALSLPVVQFDSIELGQRDGVTQIDRMVVHRKEAK
jgi:hypothetical protein